MTSQSSASSLTKQRQSWLDLVSQAPPPAAETAVVCSVQVHSQATPQEEANEEAVSESVAPPDSSASTRSIEESPAAEGEEQKDVLGHPNEGEWCAVFMPAFDLLPCTIIPRNILFSVCFLYIRFSLRLFLEFLIVLSFYSQSWEWLRWDGKAVHSSERSQPLANRRP